MASADLELLCSFGLAVGVSGLAQLAFLLTWNIVLNSTPLGARVSKELNTNKAVRPMSDPRMGLYCPFISPFVQAALTSAAFITFRAAVDVSSFSSVYIAGAHFGAILWAVSTCHGLMMDWAMYRISLDTIISFEIATFFAALINGAVIARYLA